MLEYELSKRENEELQEYLVSIKDYKSLVYTELDNLLHNPTSENQQKIIYGSLKMVANYATKIYQELKQYFVFPYSLIDFIQSGNEALINFVYEKKYDNYHSFIWAFYTALKRNIIKNHLPISWHVVEKYIEYSKRRDEFFKEHQYEADNEKMIDAYGYGEREIQHLNNYLCHNQVSTQPLNTNLLTNGLDYIPELVYYLSVRKTILEILDDVNLTERYYDILVKYFGLTTNEHDGNNISMTPSEINEQYNFNSRQRIHEIIKNTLDKIKRNEEAMKKLTLLKKHM